MPTRDRARGLPETIAILLVLAAGLRLLGALVAGFVAMGERGEGYLSDSQHVGSVLSTFGAAGDTVSALLLLGAVAVLVLGADRPTPEALTPLVRVLLAVTAVLVAVRLAGTFILDTGFSSRAAAEDSLLTAFGAGDVLLCLGGLLVLGRVRSSSAVDDAALEPLVFAIDRGNGEVFSFFSYAEAARTIGVYSVEENEFAFYADDGTLVSADVVDDRTRFTPTDENRWDELMAHLRRFAGAKGLDVAEPDDPTAYAVPIADWQWLELWPGWLRGIGRVVRRLRG